MVLPPRDSMVHSTVIGWPVEDSTERRRWFGSQISMGAVPVPRRAKFFRLLRARRWLREETSG
jgi:hypothetical protein